MPRISPEARAAEASSGAKYPAAPARLDKAGQALWREIVRSKPVSWWSPGALPLLESYCRASVRLREAEQLLDDAGLTQDGKFGPQPSAELRAVEALNRQIVALSSKLRLSVQAAVERHSGKIDEPGAGDDSLLGGNVTKFRKPA